MNFLAQNDYSNFLKKLLDKKTKKNFFFENRILYRFCILFSYAVSLLTVVSCFAFLSDLLFQKFQNTIIVYGITIIVLASIEFSKHFLLNALFSNYYSFEKTFIVSYMIIVSFIILLSCFLSYNGGKKIGTNNLASVSDSIYENRIKEAKTEIESIVKRNTYRGQTWVVGADKRLMQNLQDSIIELGKEKKQKNTEILSKMQNTQNQYAYLFCFFDLILILLLGYINYFDFAVLVENRHLLENQNFDYDSSTSEPQNQVGFKIRNDTGGGMASGMYSQANLFSGYGFGFESYQCKNCGKIDFTKNHKKQIFCCTKCHDDWHNKNRKKFR